LAKAKEEKKRPAQMLLLDEHVLDNQLDKLIHWHLPARKFCHSCYCIVILRVDRYEAAEYIRRFLKHPDFNTHRKRMGWIIEVHKTIIKGLRVGKIGEVKFTWQNI
jgi:hypothetical protein